MRLDLWHVIIMHMDAPGIINNKRVDDRRLSIKFLWILRAVIRLSVLWSCLNPLLGVSYSSIKFATQQIVRMILTVLDYRH